MNKKLVKHIALLNVALAIVSALGGAWAARNAGTIAYTAAAAAFLAVGLAATAALVITFVSSRGTDQSAAANGSNSVTGILLAMLVRMGLPIAIVVAMMQIESPLMQAGFFGLVTLNYLVALPLETMFSLQYINNKGPVASA